MASLVRLIILLAVLAVIAVAGMWALDTYVEPSPRDMTIRVPLDRVLQE